MARFEAMFITTKILNKQKLTTTTTMMMIIYKYKYLVRFRISKLSKNKSMNNKNLQYRDTTHLKLP